MRTVLPTPAPPNNPIFPPSKYGSKRSMTLIPDSKSFALGSRVSKSGASRWISHRSGTSPMSSVSRGSPNTLKIWPSTLSPTGTAIPLPVFRTTAPRVNPSVAFMQTTRTLPSPICCATSPPMVTLSPSNSASISTNVLISGSEPRGNSTSTTGPAIARTFPSLVSVLSSVMVIFNAPEVSGVVSVRCEGRERTLK